jgi:hypothetical protein
MDQVIIDVFSRLAKIHRCSVDAILESPELRAQYLAETRHILGVLPERELLHGLVSLRKRSKLPRSRDLL